MNIIETKEGWSIIEGDTHVGKWIEETGKLDHDKFLIPIACKNMRQGWVVMDCGALYGDHTIAYSKTVGAEGVVLAIEANPLAFQCLCKNAEKFESPVFCMNLALGEDHGGTAVHIMEENVGASRIGKEGANDDPIKKEVPVKTASIDGIAKDASLDRLNFIKIDCEGFELKILKGARGSIERFKPILLIEMNSWALSQQDACYKDIYDLLIELNYDWRIVQPDCKGGDQQYDVMAWPKLIKKARIVKARSLKTV